MCYRNETKRDETSRRWTKREKRLSPWVGSYLVAVTTACTRSSAYRSTTRLRTALLLSFALLSPCPPVMGQSSSSTVKITAQDRSILDLKLQRDKLKQYQKRIEVVLTREREIAKEQLALGHKDRALIALRQRKYQETLLSQTDSQLETLQKLVSSIEFAKVEQSVLFGLKQGSQVLKELNKEMDLEMVEQLMSDTAEGVAYQEEVSALLADRISAADEEEVLAELAALQAESVQDKLPSVPLAPLPELPERQPLVEEPAQEEEEEPERERRQAVLA